MLALKSALQKNRLLTSWLFEGFIFQSYSYILDINPLSKHPLEQSCPTFHCHNPFNIVPHAVVSPNYGTISVATSQL